MPLRVVIAEDQVLLREGIVRILEGAGMEVVAQTGDAEDLVRRAAAHRPDVVITDIQMPPGGGDDGLRAALTLRKRFPEMGVLVLSQFLEERYVFDLLGDDASGVGYLLKDHVGQVELFTDAIRRVAAGGSALDPQVVSTMLGRVRRQDPLADLTAREREVLELMAQGKSNAGIGEALFISPATVEKHATHIFAKLRLDTSEAEHRRVLAVLALLKAA
jgi:DNA-binding NarL/FixJ family response regulator